MLNTPSFAWVKNVYNMCVRRGVNSGFSSTPSLLRFANPQNPVNKSLVLHQFLLANPTVVSTGNFAILPLLYDSYTRFPQHLLLLRLKKKFER